MQHVIVTSARDPDTLQQLDILEVSHRVMFKRVDGQGWPEMFEPETVTPDQFVDMIIDAVKDLTFFASDKIAVEYHYCPKTGLNVCRGWVKVRDLKFYWTLSYTGQEIYKAEAKRTLLTLLLNIRGDESKGDKEPA